jgi:hypothetical protein
MLDIGGDELMAGRESWELRNPLDNYNCLGKRGLKKMCAAYRIVHSTLVQFPAQLLPRWQRGAGNEENSSTQAR